MTNTHVDNNNFQEINDIRLVTFQFLHEFENQWFRSKIRILNSSRTSKSHFHCAHRSPQIISPLLLNHYSQSNVNSHFQPKIKLIKTSRYHL